MDYTLKVLDHLKSLSDNDYKKFNKKITPGDFTMIGVNIPKLKLLIKSISNEEKKVLINMEKSIIFEMNMLKALAIANIKDIDEYKKQFDKFYSEIDNWAICDTFIAASKIIKKDKPYFFNKVKKLLKENDEFKNRIGFVILLDYFIEDGYIDELYLMIDGYKNDKYYANMALAWLISVIFIKYPKKTKTFLLKANLETEVIKMTIRKVRDSYRVSNEDKIWIKKRLS